MFERLENEVWALDRCCGCSNCVALCAKGMLSWGPGEAPVKEVREKALGLSHTRFDSCTFCQQLCEEGCPRLVEEFTALVPRRMVAARTRGAYGQSGEPADVIKHLLVAAMAAELVDGAILGDVDPWTLLPVSRVVETVGDVIDALPSPHIWAPTLSALNEAVYDRKLKNLAVVGSPCVSQALRTLQSSDNERLMPYKRALRLNIATFCTGVYRPELVGEYLAKVGISPANVKRLVASPRQDVMTAVLWDGSVRTISLAEVDGYTRHGCSRCDDYAGESADLAVGTLGAGDGYSTIIVRSQAGEIVLRTALDYGLLEATDMVDQAALERARVEKERRQRAQSFDQMTIMMLDALAEPRKRAQVKEAFVRLYGAKKSGAQSKEEENCYVTCGQC